MGSIQLSNDFLWFLTLNPVLLSSKKILSWESVRCLEPVSCMLRRLLTALTSLDMLKCFRNIQLLLNIRCLLLFNTLLPDLLEQWHRSYLNLFCRMGGIIGIVITLHLWLHSFLSILDCGGSGKCDLLGDLFCDVGEFPMIFHVILLIWEFLLLKTFFVLFWACLIFLEEMVSFFRNMMWPWLWYIIQINLEWFSMPFNNILFCHDKNLLWRPPHISHFFPRFIHITIAQWCLIPIPEELHILSCLPLYSTTTPTFMVRVHEWCGEPLLVHIPTTFVCLLHIHWHTEIFSFIPHSISMRQLPRCFLYSWVLWWWSIWCSIAVMTVCRCLTDCTSLDHIQGLETY